MATQSGFLEVMGILSFDTESKLHAWLDYSLGDGEYEGLGATYSVEQAPRVSVHEILELARKSGASIDIGEEMVVIEWAPPDDAGGSRTCPLAAAVIASSRFTAVGAIHFGKSADDRDFTVRVEDGSHELAELDDTDTTEEMAPVNLDQGDA